MTTQAAELEDLIDSTVTIPTIPSTLSEINRVFASPDGSAREAGATIEKDPAIAAKLLRIVNSSFYGLKNPVSAIPLACSILGLKVIKNLVVQATVLDRFTSGPELEDFDPSWLWNHSFKTAMAARLLARATTKSIGLDKDDAYTCGLIHDVGKMLLLQNQAKQFAVALQLSRKKNVPLQRMEQQVFGFTHAHVGGLLAERWKLAPELQQAVRGHHEPADQQTEATFLVHAANTLAHRAVVDRRGGWNGDVSADDAIATRLGVTQTQLDEIVEEVRHTSLSS